MNKDKEIELFRRNKLSEYEKIVEMESITKLSKNLPQCWQCKQHKVESEFLILNKNGICLCKECAEKNYKKAIRNNKWLSRGNNGRKRAFN